MGDDAVTRQIDEHMVETWSALVSQPGVYFYQGSDFCWFVSGVKHPLCNGILKVDMEEDEAGPGIERALEIFRTRELPMLCWVTPSTRPAGLPAVLEAQGLEKMPEVTGMAIELSSLSGSLELPEEVEIRRVCDREGFSCWIDVFCRVYGFPDDAGAFFSRAYSWAGMDEGAPFSHYVATLQGEPVGCSTTFTFRQVAGLYNVGTLNQARKRGVGRVCSLVPLLEAAGSGCTRAVLPATEMGKPLYRDIGFREECRLGAYLFTP